ncbi:helicase [Microbacterium thalassium]|uniref:Type IV secretory pathway TrbL component n=1 Tax=Microbacterium thalassium TaxID=362649 RepID=A0A7X0FS20_9MICO|nr:helicase [Microbacterium thalassium]MBB6392616.1 type IV secretory pathway TrbL component [Microbacterium thalassium]GLK23153.1 hypothetical protein GCM10017607_04710 [Microbacterium thalassium]
MAGSGLTVAVAAVSATCAVALCAVAAGAVEGQRAAAAADAAALAAADAASGAIPGYPCERAQEVAGALGFEVAECDLSALIATVSVRGGIGPMHATATSRAGPPP